MNNYVYNDHKHKERIFPMEFQDEDYNKFSFKSLNSEISDIKTLKEYIGEILKYQKYQTMFKKKILSMERNKWNYNELENFKINLENIDRLYYISHYNEDGITELEVVCRMQYNNNDNNLPIYFILIFDYDTSEFLSGKGYIYMTKSPKLFMTIIFPNLPIYNHQLNYRMYESLKEDGIYLPIKEKSPLIEIYEYEGSNQNKKLLENDYKNILIDCIENNVFQENNYYINSFINYE